MVNTSRMLCTILWLGTVASVQGSIFDPPGYWSFAVRDGQTITVVFPSSWPSVNVNEGIEELQFRVKKSYKKSFTLTETVTFDSLNAVDGMYFGIDAWNGTWMYYQVDVYLGDELLDRSQPLRAVDQGKVTFVSPIGGGDSEDCGNLRLNPCKTLQSALRSASVSGNDVYALPGRYTGPGNVDVDVMGLGITITSTNGPKYSMIDCSESVTSARGFKVNNGESASTIIDGFTILGGQADDGGCLYIRNASPVLSNMAFIGCKAIKGGAVYVDGDESNPSIIDSVFFYNQANEGGGVHVTNGASLSISTTSIELGVCGSDTGLGGGVYALRAKLTIQDSIIKNCISAFAGGGIMLDDSSATLDGVEIRNNTVANTGGGINLFGSEMKILKSKVVENNSNVFGGGLVCTTSNLTVHESEFVSNYAGIGGGAIKLLGGILNVTSSSVSSNVAGEYGSAFDVTTQGPLSSEKTVMYVDMSDVSNNIADRGAAMFLYALDLLKVSRTTFRNNSALRGGAIWCESDTLSEFEAVQFLGNAGREGGAIYASLPCKMRIASSEFFRNGAAETGGAIVATEGTDVSILSSRFVENGYSLCEHRQTPMHGGAIAVGVKDFSIEDTCSPMNSTQSTHLTISASEFVSNIAQTAGGALFGESGTLDVSMTTFYENGAGLVHTRNGFGGAIATIERCTENECSQISARFSDIEIKGNQAQLAGGGAYVSGLNPQSGLEFVNTKFLSNDVTSGFSTRVGGGLFFNTMSMNLTYVQFSNNSARLGGGVYISANVTDSSQVVLDNIYLSDNQADSGLDIYWERGKSAVSSLNLTSVVSTNLNPSSVATEAIEVVVDSGVPERIESGKTFPPFILNVVDFYGEKAKSENGECEVVALPDIDGHSASIRPLGSKVPMDAGNVHFGQLQMTGAIGNMYDMEIRCRRKVEETPGILSYTALPAVSFAIEVTDCPEGYSPAESGEGDICVICQYGTYNTDGKDCVACPKGATCPGGSSLLSDANWWRSGPSSLEFYQCRYPDVCSPGPVSGNDACAQGHQGPLCGVCKNGWFEFGGKCRACNNNPTSKIFLAFSCVIASVIVILLFAKSWDFGDPASPGLLSKVKILLMHFQIISLLKQYDILWPPETSEGFSWISVVEFGPSMLAPECIVGDSYSFWSAWIIQMCLPVLVLALCFGIYRIASVAIKARDQRDLSDTKFTKWLEGLRFRCYKNAYWLITLLYPGACFVALQMFSREKLDTGTYLTADLSIKITDDNGKYTSTYIGYMIPGAMLLILLSLGVPLFCLIAIWRHRNQLDDPYVSKTYGFLYGSYDRRTPYWEAVQMLRRFVFALIPVFVKPNANGSLQGTIAQVISMFLLITTVWLMPFAQKADNFIEIASQVIINLLLISGCAATWANISSTGMKALAVIQLLLSSIIAFVVVLSIAHGVVILLNKRRQRRMNGRGESSKASGAVHVHVAADAQSSADSLQLNTSQA